MELKTSTDKIETLSTDGIIVGYYEDTNNFSFLDSISDILNLGDFKGKFKEKLLLYNVKGINSNRICLVGLGKKDKVDHENVRVAASIGARTLRDLGIKKIGINTLNNNALSTAEGVVLGLYRFDELKTVNLDKLKSIEEVTFCGSTDDIAEWNKGVNIALGENHARRLAELPSNYATPTYVANNAKEILSKFQNVEVIIRDEEWAKDRKMGSFLSVTKGAERPAKFLEIHYKGGIDKDQPLVLVGKGITFDTGGISLKGSAGMGMMRGDMGGAAAVIGALFGISSNSLNVNVVGLIPLCENKPSGSATNPSDVVIASNGKTIQVDNTDAEGRLILADALVYAEEFNPHTVIDLATLTGSIGVALGSAYIGAFTRSDELWSEIESSGTMTFERFWRMPLDKIYRKQLDTSLADINNVGGRAGGSCTAAMFLGEFIEMKRWAHLDIAGVAWTTSIEDYQPKGMTGKPVRALVNLAEKYTK